MLLLISPCMAVSICLIYLGASMLSAYIYNFYMSLDHYIVSFFVSCNILYFKVYFVWYEYCSSFLLISICMEYFLFHAVPFRLCVFLDLKWVSYRQHIYGSCFCIHSVSLCLLVRAFNPCIFKVIIDKYAPIAIYFVVLHSSWYTFSVFPV